jgi:hypothetical protein
MRAREEHGGPLPETQPLQAYAMRVAGLLGKPSRSQRNPREDQRVLLSFPRKRSQGQSDRGLLLHQRDSQNVVEHEFLRSVISARYHLAELQRDLPPFASPGASAQRAARPCFMDLTDPLRPFS